MLAANEVPVAQLLLVFDLDADEALCHPDRVFDRGILPPHHLPSKHLPLAGALLLNLVVQPFLLGLAVIIMTQSVIILRHAYVGALQSVVVTLLLKHERVLLEQIGLFLDLMARLRHLPRHELRRDRHPIDVEGLRLEVAGTLVAPAHPLEAGLAAEAGPLRWLLPHRQGYALWCR